MLIPAATKIIYKRYSPPSGGDSFVYAVSDRYEEDSREKYYLSGRYCKLVIENGNKSE